MPWTAEELEAIRIADEEIERCDLTYEDYKAARSLDEYITEETRADKMRKIRQREYRKANKDEIAAYKREYRKANKDEIAAYQREYRKANKDEIAAYQREYYKANKDKLKAYQREYYKARRAAAHQ